MTSYNIVIVFICLLFAGTVLYFLLRRKKGTFEKDCTNDIPVNIDAFNGMLQARDAKILSVHPREITLTNPSERIVRFRLAVKEEDDSYTTHSVKWIVPNFTLTEYSQGKIIGVRVYENYVFPSIEGAVLLDENSKN